MNCHNLFIDLLQLPSNCLFWRDNKTNKASSNQRKVILLETPLAGFQYHRAPAIWPFLRLGESLHLRREPNNPYDHNAIAVWFKNEHLGYIPRCNNPILAQLLDQGEHLKTTIIQLQKDAEDPWRKVRLQITWIHQKQSKPALLTPELLRQPKGIR
jgi:hypothetical protein